jgi:hypothetical protein
MTSTTTAVVYYTIYYEVKDTGVESLSLRERPNVRCVSFLLLAPCSLLLAPCSLFLLLPTYLCYAMTRLYVTIAIAHGRGRSGVGIRMKEDEE